MYLSDIWPSGEEIRSTIAEAVRQDMFERSYADVFTGDERWLALDLDGDHTWPEPTYVRELPSTSRAWTRSRPLSSLISGARTLAMLGDSVTTDYISPASDPQGQPRGPVADRERRRAARLQLLRLTARKPRGDDPRHLRERGSCATGWSSARAASRDISDGEETTIYEAAMAYAGEGVPLVVLAGRSTARARRATGRPGNQCCWCARRDRGELERIHRSNLIGMGVLPLQFPEGETIDSLGLTGEEVFDVGDLEEERRRR